MLRSGEVVSVTERTWTELDSFARRNWERETNIPLRIFRNVISKYFGARDLSTDI